ncbi:MAG: M23 family metallopeptidase [Verrucomicrobiota bacterium]
MIARSPAILLLAPALVLWAGASSLSAETKRIPMADGFDFPVGKPDAEGYYKARGFWPNGHLGEDWNDKRGGNSDLGAPVYSIGKGIVVQAHDVKVGWGNVVIVRHIYRDRKTGKLRLIDSLYGHLNEIKVKKGAILQRGQLLGTIGTNRGMYAAHLHFEIRKNIYVGMHRSSYKKDFSVYHDPTPFIRANRKLRNEFRRYPVPVNTFKPYP